MYRERLRVIDRLAEDRGLPGDVSRLLREMLLTLVVESIPKAPSLIHVATPPRPSTIPLGHRQVACNIQICYHQINLNLNYGTHSHHHVFLVIKEFTINDVFATSDLTYYNSYKFGVRRVSYDKMGVLFARQLLSMDRIPHRLDR